MIGLMFLGFFAVYFFVSFLVVKGTVSWAKRNSRNRWMWGFLSAFLMYNLVFWDSIPTLALYHYKNNVEAGFWVYETPEQWAIDNSEAVKTLEHDEMEELRGIEHIDNGTISHINQRIEVIDLRSDLSFDVRRIESLIKDTKTKKILAKEIRFTLGDCGNALPVKFWLHKCSPENRIYAIQRKFRVMGGKE